MTAVRLGNAARQALTESVRRSARAISPSLGPSGRAVLMHRPPAAPVLLTDGYAIAREAADEAGPGSLGARILKETLFEIDRDLGDGTATAALLIDSLLAGGQRLVRSGYSAGTIADALLQHGRKLAKEADTLRLAAPPEAVAVPIARTAGADVELAERIARAFLELGADGFLRVEEGYGAELEIRVRRGTTVDALLVSRLLSDATDRIFVRLEQPYILVADEEIEDFGRLLPVLEGFAAHGKALLVVARDVSGAALQSLVRNKLQAGFRVAALRILDAIERGYEALEDLAIVVGAELVSARIGSSVSALRPHMLGRAEAVEIQADGARVLGGAGRPERIELRRAELRQRIARERYLSYDREQLQRRLARLSAGFATILVGGRTEVERQVRLTSARKAVAALKAARAGAVPGGGVVPLRLAALLRKQTGTDAAADAAGRVLAAGLLRIPQTILVNGGQDAGPWLERMARSAAPCFGFDVRTGVVCDLFGAGVLDPVTIVSGILQRAVSAAATLLRAEAIVA